MVYILQDLKLVLFMDWKLRTKSGISLRRKESKLQSKSPVCAWFGGTVNNKRRGTTRVLTEEAHIEVLGIFAAKPTSSLRPVAQQTGISHESMRQAPKKYYFYPCRCGLFTSFLNVKKL